MTNELKTGIVAVAALAVAAMFFLKTVDIGKAPYQIKAYFNYADGVKPDTVVKLSGIDVGRVVGIRFEYTPETKIEVTMAVNKEAKVREDSIAFISTSGMIGDAFIGITPGSGEKAFVKPGTVLASEDPIEMRKLMKKADAIAANLDATLVEVKKLAENANTIVKDNRTRIDNIVLNLEATSVNFKDFSEDIKQHPWKLLMKK